MGNPKGAGRKKMLHGGALNNSEFAMYVAFWLQNNPRMSAGRIRNRLVDQFGVAAKFSLPHIRAWMENYYPDIVKNLVDAVQGSGVHQTVVKLTDSALFGNVVDSLDYHQRMVQFFEKRLKQIEEEHDIVRKVITQEPDSDDLPGLVKSLKILRDQMVKFGNLIRVYKVYIDEWQRTHEFGERMGDLLIKMAEVSIDILATEIDDDGKRKSALDEYKLAVDKLAIQFRVPQDTLYG